MPASRIPSAFPASLLGGEKRQKTSDWCSDSGAVDGLVPRTNQHEWEQKSLCYKDSKCRKTSKTCPRTCQRTLSQASLGTWAHLSTPSLSWRQKILLIIVKCWCNFAYKVYLDHRLLGCLCQSDPLTHLEIKRLKLIKRDKTPRLPMNSPLYGSVTKDNEPKVTSGWIQGQALGSVSHCP